MKRVLLCLLGTAFVAPGAAGQSLIRDSASVQIVTSTAGAWRTGQEWQLSRAPAWSVRVDAPVVGARQLSDGRVAVLTAGWLRVYDARGRFSSLATAGSGGLRQAVWLGQGRGDTLLVWDRGAHRLLAVGARGVARTAAPPELNTLFADVLGAYADGSFLGTPGPDLVRLSSAPTGTYRNAEPYLHFSPTGAPMGTVGRFVAEELHVYRRGSRSMWEPLPFGRRTVVVTAGGRYYVAGTGTYQIAVYSSAGRLERLVRVPVSAQPVTRAELTQLLRRRTMAASAERRAELEQVLEGATVPATMPVLTGLQVDAAGHLWVQEFSPPSSSANRWAVFDPAGRLLGRVNMPQGLRVVQVGRDFVLGVAAAGTGAEQVQRYALVRR